MLKTDYSVAVIVPLLNEKEELSSRIQSLQALNANELVFVDGGSTDGTRQLLQQSGLTWLASTRGRAAQMNAGAEVSTSDIFIFIHIDTDLDQSNICAVKSAMSQLGIVGGRFDIRLSNVHPAYRIIAWFINTRSRWSKISTGDQAIFVRRDIFERLHGFPEQPLMEDIEFSRRLKREGEIACLRQQVITSSRRWQQYGIVRTILLMWWLRLLYWLGTPAEKLAAMYRDAR